MARVFIDPHMFSAQWFKDVLTELVGSKKVTFLFSNCAQGIGEVERVKQALKFKKLMRATKKAIEASSDEVDQHILILERHPPFSRCADCDDPHIMAAVFIHPTPYVFSEDHRLARCRDKISGTIDRRYGAFAVVSDAPTYGRLRAHII